MNQLPEALKSVSNFLWRPIHFDFEGEEKNAYIFNIKEVSEDSSFMDDLFGDGMPDNLDLEEKVPFCLIGYHEGDETDFKKGNLEALDQPEHLLFVDIEHTDKDNAPVYSIEIDGTAIPTTFKRMGNLRDIEIKMGFVSEE